jgi:hypothetical protein
MTKISYHTAVIFLAFIILACSASGAFVYKNYVIQHDQGSDILCDPYIVQKNDWVIKLFQRRGQISEQDFPEFLRIFQRLNPHIHNVDKILPGQNILIPLKKLVEDAFPGQSSGIVTIPFVTISKLPDIVKENAVPHKVKSGEYVSGIVSSEFGNYGSKSYSEGIQLFRLINPGIVDLNRIYPGQIIQVPNAALKKMAWYAALFNAAGEINKDLDINGLMAAAETKVPKQVENNPPENIRSPDPVASAVIRTPLSEAAHVLNAKMFTRGTYFFPRKGRNDLKLDLTRFPVMELAGGQKLLFAENNDFSQTDKTILRSHWPGLKIIPLPFQSSFEEILDTVFKSDQRFKVKNRLTVEHQGTRIDINAKWIVQSNPTERMGGKKQSTACIFIVGPNDGIIPDPLKRYLATFDIRIEEIDKNGELIKYPDQAIGEEKQDENNTFPGFYGNQAEFIAQMVSMINYRYSENMDISFPYAGIQVQALSNLVSSPDGEQLLVDFGSLYGEAVSSIRNSGLNIIQVFPDDNWMEILKNFTPALNITSTENPLFKGANRSDDYNIQFHFPGFKIETPGKKSYLISQSRLHSDLIKFLHATGIEAMMIPAAPASQPVSGPIIDGLRQSDGE